MNKIIEGYYEENFDDLVRSVSNSFDNPQDAEDAVQDSFVKALQYSGSYKEGSGNFEGWYRRILQNSIKDVKNVIRNKGMSTSLDDEDVEEELRSGKVTREVIVHDEHELIVDATTVSTAVEGSKPPLRNIVTLFYYKDLGPKEISQALGMKYKTVRQALWRFNKRLRELL